MIHFLLTHFPIALLLTGAALLLWALITKQDRIGAASIAMLTAGTLISVPTVLAGLWIAAEHQGHHSQILDTHRLLGIATMVVGLLGLLSHQLRQQVANADLARNLLFIAAAALAGATGFVGGEMTHGGAQVSTASSHGHGEDSHAESGHGATDDSAAKSDVSQLKSAQPSGQVEDRSASKEKPAAKRKQKSHGGHDHDSRPHDH